MIGTEVLYYGEIWFWINGEERLIGRSHLKKWKVMIRKENVTKKVSFSEIKKTTH